MLENFLFKPKIESGKWNVVSINYRLIEKGFHYCSITVFPPGIFFSISVNYFFLLEKSPNSSITDLVTTYWSGLLPVQDLLQPAVSGGQHSSSPLCRWLTGPRDALCQDDPVGHWEGETGRRKGELEMDRRGVDWAEQPVSPEVVDLDRLGVGWLGTNKDKILREVEDQWDHLSLVRRGK